MLTCFLAEKDIDCKILWYGNRIWLKDDCGAEVMCSFIVEVSQKNAHALNKISFLIPRPISDLENLSRFSTDSAYTFNQEGRTTGEIKVINEHRVIFDDFDCRVRHKHSMSPHFYEGTTRVDIDLRDELTPPGSRELFLLKFNVSGLIKKLPNTSIFKFYYFCPEQSKRDAFSALSHGYSVVPIVPIYNLETRQGGFDIFVYAPPAQEVRSVIGKYTHVEINFNSKGERLPRKRSGVLWHLRELIESPQELIVWKKGVGFNKRQQIEGTVEVPVVYQDINALKKSSISNFIIGVIAAIAGIVALILSIILFLSRSVPQSPPP